MKVVSPNKVKRALKCLSKKKSQLSYSLKITLALALMGASGSIFHLVLKQDSLTKAEFDEVVELFTQLKSWRDELGMDEWVKLIATKEDIEQLKNTKKNG